MLANFSRVSRDTRRVTSKRALHCNKQPNCKLQVASTRNRPWPTPAMFLCIVTLTFDLLTLKINGFPEPMVEHFSDFCVKFGNILAASVFFNHRMEQETNTQTPLKPSTTPLRRSAWPGTSVCSRPTIAEESCQNQNENKAKLSDSGQLVGVMYVA